jgi:L-rhamnose mutarotase
MERVCFVGRVREERLAEYRERHERVWPEMLAAGVPADRRDLPPGLTSQAGK